MGWPQRTTARGEQGWVLLILNQDIASWVSHRLGADTGDFAQNSLMKEAHLEGHSSMGFGLVDWKSILPTCHASVSAKDKLNSYGPHCGSLLHPAVVLRFPFQLGSVLT